MPLSLRARRAALPLLLALVLLVSYDVSRRRGSVSLWPSGGEGEGGSGGSGSGGGGGGGEAALRPAFDRHRALALSAARGDALGALLATVATADGVVVFTTVAAETDEQVRGIAALALNWLRTLRRANGSDAHALIVSLTPGLCKLALAPHGVYQCVESSALCLDEETRLPRARNIRMGYVTWAKWFFAADVLVTRRDLRLTLLFSDVDVAFVSAPARPTLAPLLWQAWDFAALTDVYFFNRTYAACLPVYDEDAPCWSSGLWYATSAAAAVTAAEPGGHGAAGGGSEVVARVAQRLLCGSSGWEQQDMQRVVTDAATARVGHFAPRAARLATLPTSLFANVNMWQATGARNASLVAIHMGYIYGFDAKKRQLRALGLWDPSYAVDSWQEAALSGRGDGGDDSGGGSDSGGGGWLPLPPLAVDVAAARARQAAAVTAFRRFRVSRRLRCAAQRPQKKCENFPQTYPPPDTVEELLPWKEPVFYIEQ